MPSCCALLQGLYLVVSLSFLRVEGALEGCKIAIMDLSDSSYGLPKCDVNERVRSLGGVVVANKPDRQGESHQYSQASGPYWLHESIKASPYYTRDPEAATVVYVYDYCIQAWATAAAFGGGFKDGLDPGLILTNSYTQVLNSSRWMRHGGIDFVFFAAHPLMGPSHSYKTACEEFGRSNHLVVEAAQRLTCKEEEARRSYIVVPYSSPLFADRHERATSPPAQRNISLFFRAQCAEDADMTGNDVFYGLRMRRHMVGAVQSAQDPHASVHCTNEAGRMPYDDMLAAMQRSTFCLMPPGETASSRRLTDAVLSGCIPVFIGPPWHEMPLPDYVKYTEFSVFITAQQPRTLYGGKDIGIWASLEASPHEAVSNVYDPIFWFPAVDISEMAIPVDDLAQLPEKLRGLPEADVRHRQARLAEAQPLFRYRRRPEELNLPGRVTASDAIIEEMCGVGASVMRAAAVQSAARSAAVSAARSAALSVAQSAAQPMVEPAAPPTPLPTRHVERPRQMLHKAGHYMHQAVRRSLGRQH